MCPPIRVGGESSGCIGGRPQKSVQGGKKKSAKGAGHHIWQSGTPLVLERAKDMVFGQGPGGGVARVWAVFVRAAGKVKAGRENQSPLGVEGQA